MTTPADNDPRQHLFALFHHLLATPSEPLPPSVRAWLLAGQKVYLESANVTLDQALNLRARGRAHPARDWRLAQRDRTLREHATRHGFTAADIQSAIRRRRRRAPGRAAQAPVDTAVESAWSFAPIPESEAQLRRILRPVA
ncbi:MAG: hypothetical protein K9L32_11435 [Chromatiaceae bacterium]|nr:hypothetical protein [Chromatiaceae bacterium]MCF8004790.1 hypothetical protein [Chromatiaceae bacterium]